MRWALVVSCVLLLLVVREAWARDAAQVRAFRATHPCPSTGKTGGACPGWVVDHVRPLCDAGRDAPSNMQWQKKNESYKKDAIEREICKQPRVR